MQVDYYEFLSILIVIFYPLILPSLIHYMLQNYKITLKTVHKIVKIMLYL